jgi:hypothetical protein
MPMLVAIFHINGPRPSQRNQKCNIKHTAAALFGYAEVGSGSLQGHFFPVVTL